MHEPDVTITDFLLAAEALILAAIIAGSGATTLHRWFVTFFLATAAAALFGALVHGFFADNKVLWRSVLVSLGLVSAAAWTIGAQLLFDQRIAGRVAAAALVETALYSLIVVFVSDKFVVAIVNYLPSTLFLIVAFLASYRAQPVTPLALGLSGLVLTLIAAGVQQARLALHPTYFNHNALYHLLQAIALWLIFRSAVFLSAIQ